MGPIGLIEPNAGLHDNGSPVAGKLGLQRRATMRALFFVTYRSEDIHPEHPLAPFLAKLGSVRSVRPLEVPPLTAPISAVTYLPGKNARQKFYR
jgi:hypothetical protein